jgi:hypothetical protein
LFLCLCVGQPFLSSKDAIVCVVVMNVHSM